MPAKPPFTAPDQREQLNQLGAQLRSTRKAQGVSMVTAAEVAGMSRVTWHRIERGEPAVTMGGWMSAAGALGLRWSLQPQHPPSNPALPERIVLADYPQLRQLAWQLESVDTLEPAQALSLYERQWRHVDTAALTPHEAALIGALSATIGGGRLLV